VRRFLTTAFALGMLASGAYADDATTDGNLDMQFGSHAEFRKVFDTLRAGVKTKDAAKVASVISYPITVRAAGKKLTVKTPKVFIANYAAIMKPSIAKAVEDASYGELFVNSEGAMIGQGEVWIGGTCSDNACSKMKVGVITIQDTQN
jgi:hypothetical protein